MIAEVGLAFAGLVLVLDGWRLRRRLKRLTAPRLPVNVLASGILLPEPDDPRWSIIDRQRRVVNSAFPGTFVEGPPEKVLHLGTVSVTLNDRKLFIDDTDALLASDPSAKIYAEAVIIAYFSRRSLMSIEGAPHA